MPDLKTYLASKYMSGPKADAILQHAGVEKKKRKRKNEDYVGGSSKASGSGLVLQDEDERWGKKDADDMEGDDTPVIGKDIATFKKGKSAWATVGATALPLPAGVKEEPRDAASDDAGPSTTTAGAQEQQPKQQLTKRRGGLRTAKQLAEEAKVTAAEQRSPSPEPGGPDPTQTVYRDQSGKVLDVEALRQEARRAEEEEKRKEAERKEWSKGLAQRQAREERVREEKAMGNKDVARYADDEAMNREMKDVERWNDPAANFATTKKGKKKGPKIPVYKGSWPENRFGLAPGYRWDGVDRSNGFEKKWLQAQNTYARTAVEASKWSMEDM
ncbi:Pre-mRNA-splicing factor cwc26 [Apiotrichum porosum]|uniref:Pre-mRNA-splicing factor cwc26 n=1 Tax=Apiotrichum porosum TaxID=105984 RepID=A0A427XNN8_9TREE|nr:Pre-mRNA-splicing factor cwc26 [Apiotrichum porosum]RSH80337.1 Pre-mRNA-splicing factor cwc26 [Apiotrichum porosum]